LPKEALITRNEAILLVVIAVFAVLWMVWVVPWLSASVWYQQQIPPVQFLVFELGFITGIVAVIGFPIQYAYYRLKKRVSVPKTELVLGALKIGVSFWVGNKFIMDMWEPPFYLSTSGAVLLNNSEAMTKTAVDATVAWVWQQIGASGFLLYFATYVIFPVVCIALVLLAFTWKKVVKIFSGF
jgi:hypothetical protein